SPSARPPSPKRPLGAREAAGRILAAPTQRVLGPCVALAREHAPVAVCSAQLARAQGPVRAAEHRARGPSRQGADRGPCAHRVAPRRSTAPASHGSALPPLAVVSKDVRHTGFLAARRRPARGGLAGAPTRPPRAPAGAGGRD